MKTMKISKLKPKGISFKGIKHKKTFIFILILVVIVGITGITVSKPKSKVVTNYSELKRGDMIKKISTMGKVESNNKTNVYSTLNNVIKEVKVSAGDKVHEGDVLCILDSSALEKEIAEAESEAKYNKDKAKVDLDGKKESYDKALNDVDSSVKDSEAAVKTAKIKLEDAQRDYNNQKKLYESGAVEQEKFNQAKSSLNTAQAEYEKSIADLDNAKVKAQNDVETAKNSYDAAQVEYSNAKSDVVLKNKKDSVQKCVITAPVSGTVTVVNAEVGNNAGGVLFTIEDLDDPLITVEIKEIDVNKVKPEQDVEVTTDATEDGEFAAGKIINITDTVKNQGGEMNSSASSNNGGNAGARDSSTSAKFEAKISLNNPGENDDIKVGMSAKANIILDKKEDVFSVPFSSILEEDEKYVEILKKSDDGKYVVHKVPVETGMETDVDVEINSEYLDEGDHIIMDPSSYNDGDIVELMPNGGGVMNE